MEKGQKIILQRLFIGAVFPQILGEILIVGVCKSIGGVMNQLSQCVVINEKKPFFSFQPLGEPSHISAGIFIVVSPEPLTPNGTLEIGGRISVRLDAPDEKSTDVSLRGIGHIFFHKVLPKAAVAFPSHGASPFQRTAGIVTHLRRQCVNKDKNLVFTQGFPG